MGNDLALPGAVSTTGLTLPANLSFERWEQVGETLGRIGRAHQWWLGDWINYGERAYGEKYAQAIEDTGLDYQTTANYAWVASQVSRRRETLSFSHHAEVAALDPAEQNKRLDEAEAGNWTRNELRRAIRETKLLPPPKPAKGTFSTLVIDPPWPMEKIEREVRPNQAAPLDYRTMSEDELRAFTVPAADDAHLYLWTTHRFLPLALEAYKRNGETMSEFALLTRVQAAIEKASSIADATRGRDQAETLRAYAVACEVSGS